MNPKSRGRLHLLQQKLPVYPTLTPELAIRHLVHQTRELILGEMGARTLDSPGNIGADACTANGFHLRDREAHPLVPLCFHSRTPRKKTVRRRTIGAI
jgi:hypothetical protein